MQKDAGRRVLVERIPRDVGTALDHANSEAALRQNPSSGCPGESRTNDQPGAVRHQPLQAESPAQPQRATSSSRARCSRMVARAL